MQSVACTICHAKDSRYIPVKVISGKEAKYGILCQKCAKKPTDEITSEIKRIGKTKHDAVREMCEAFKNNCWFCYLLQECPVKPLDVQMYL